MDKKKPLRAEKPTSLKQLEDYVHEEFLNISTDVCLNLVTDYRKGLEKRYNFKMIYD